MIQPLYPRLGLLGGTPEAGGKVSKLAALAQARKKREAEKIVSPSETPSTPQADKLPSSPPESRGAPRSLAERLAASAKSSKPEGSLRRLGKAEPAALLQQQKLPPSAPIGAPVPSVPESSTIATGANAELKEEPEPLPPAAVLRASPSMFASTIVGDGVPKMAEPSHLHSNSVDLLKIYGQDHAEPFDFAGPSPDDVVLDAQNTAKGLAIRRKV